MTELITAIITALAYWALLQVCNRAPSGSKRGRFAVILGGGGPGAVPKGGGGPGAVPK